MKIKTQLNMDSKRYVKALKIAQKLKEFDLSETFEESEVTLLGYLSSCVALDALVNYILYILGQEAGSNLIYKRFNRLRKFIHSFKYDRFPVKEDEQRFLADKIQLDKYLLSFYDKYFKEKEGLDYMIYDMM